MIRKNLKNKPLTRSQIIKKLDKIYADRVKTRDKYTCQRCFKQTGQLQCSHYWSRRNMGTRFDLNNLTTLDSYCHRISDSDKHSWYTDYMKKKLGEAGYEKLRIKALAVTKFPTSDLRFLLEHENP